MFLVSSDATTPAPQSAPAPGAAAKTLTCCVPAGLTGRASSHSPSTPVVACSPPGGRSCCMPGWTPLTCTRTAVSARRLVVRLRRPPPSTPRPRAADRRAVPAVTPVLIAGLVRVASYKVTEDVAAGRASRHRAPVVVEQIVEFQPRRIGRRVPRELPGGGRGASGPSSTGHRSRPTCVARAGIIRTATGPAVPWPRSTGCAAVTSTDNHVIEHRAAARYAGWHGSAARPGGPRGRAGDALS